MSFETGRIGRQASGAVVASLNETMVYSTVCIEREAKPVDFTPLRVDYFAVIIPRFSTFACFRLTFICRDLVR